MSLSPAEKADKVVEACRGFKEVPDLSERLNGRIRRAGGGVASTFFGGPDVAAAPPGSLDEMVTKLAVQHLTWQVSQNERFAPAVDTNTAARGIEAFLGAPASSDAGVPGTPEGATILLQDESPFLGKVVDLSPVSQWRGVQPPVPATVTNLLALPAEMNQEFGSRYGQYVSAALFDEEFEEKMRAVHGELNWAALASDRAFVEAYQQRMCDENFIKQEVEFWIDQRYFSVQAVLYVSYKLDKKAYAAVCDTWRRVMAPIQPEKLRWASDLFNGIISGTRLMAALSTNLNIVQPFAGVVSEKCNAMETHSDRWLADTGASGGMPLYVVAHDYTWGSAVEAWLRRGDGPAAGDLPGLTTSRAPDNHQRQTQTEGQAIGGCFVPGTRVLLKGGKSKPIEKLSEGDRVICDTGGNDGHHHRDQNHAPALGLVSSEHVSIQLAKGSRVIGFNEFEPFFTAEHVFFTSTGLRAVDPLAAQKENAWLKVGQLRVGDVVLHTKDGHTYEHVRINTFTYALYSGPVYGVHLREGLRSYHANGFKVFLNYPEITLERMHKGISAMQPKQKANLLRQLKEAGPLLDKALGFKASAYLEQSVGALYDLPNDLEADAWERHLYRKKHGHPVKRNALGRHLNPGVPLHAVRTVHLNLKHEDNAAGSDADAAGMPAHTRPEVITLWHGRILVDGVAPEHQRLTEHEVHWSRPLTPDMPEGGQKGIWEHGAMKLASHRLSGFGTMFFTAGMDGPEVGIPKKFTVKGAMRYHTKHAAMPDADNAPEQPVPASEGNNWVAFPDIIIAPDDASGQLDAWLDIRDIEGNVLNADGIKTTFGFSNDNKMQVTITIDPSMVATLPDDRQFIAYEAWFSYDSLTFGGYMWAYDTDKNENKGARYDWFGNVVPEPLPAVRATPAMAAAAVPGTGAGKHLLATAPEPSLRVFAEPHPKLFTATDSVLSLEHLTAIELPGSDLSHQTNMKLMRNAMIWHLDDDTRNAFGMSKPEASSLRCGGVDLTSIFTNAERDVLVKDFGHGYISQIVALSTDKTLSGLYSSDEKQTLNNFMRGSGPGTLSGKKEYNFINFKTSACAYMYLCPTLQNYATNGQDGKQWAKDLYNHLNNDSTLRGFVLQMRVLGGSERVHHLCMMMNALDPGSLLGQQLSSDIMRMQLSMTLGYVDNGGQKDLKGLMKDIIKELVAQVLAGQEFGEKTFLGSLSKVTTDLLNEYAEEIDQAQIDKKEFIAEKADRMLSSLVEMFSYSRDIPWKAVRDWFKGVKADPSAITPTRRNPDGTETPEPMTETKLQKFTRWVSYITQVLSLAMTVYNNVQAFMVWGGLNDELRARLVISTVQTVFTALRSVGELTGLIETDLPLSKAAADGLKMNAEMQNAIARTPLSDQAPVDAVRPEAAQEGVQEETQVANNAATGEGVGAGASRFKLGPSVMRGINLAFLIAGGIFTGMDLAREDKRSSKFYLDVFTEIAQGITIGVEVGILAINAGVIDNAVIIAGETLGSVLACVGALACLTAIVLSLVSIFVSKPSQDPPKSPAQTWVEGTGKAFLKPLAAQKKPDPPVLTDTSKVTFGNSNTEVSFTITPPSYVGADKDKDGNITKPYTLTGNYKLVITNTRDADNKPGIDLFKDPLTFERKADDSPTDTKVTGLKPGYSYVFSVTCTNTAAEDDNVSDPAYLNVTMPK